MKHMDNSTIAAVATPVGSGGIGIIKISGKNAFKIASAIFKKKGSNCYQKTDYKSQKLYLGNIINIDSGKVIDEVLLSAMKAPNSYTREDVIEINAHSGPVALNEILKLVIKNGARLAEPGEFTKRAFLKGRIDLTQAEAVIDIINARTKKSLEIASSQIDGDLKKSIYSIRKSLLNILAEIEARIDFPDETDEIIEKKKYILNIEKGVVKPLRGFIEIYESGHLLREGIRLVVVGKPNVGKSSLMNRMAKKDRAIVTSIPGTTRDIIEETISINGIPAIITDTAGLHDSEDPIEVIGIKKAYENIKHSDIVLFMVDASRPLTKEDYKIQDDFNEKNLILVINKTDLVEENFEIETPESWKKLQTVKISALYNKGIERLTENIRKVAMGDFSLNGQNRIIPNLRHKIAMESCLIAANRAVGGLKNEKSYEFIAIDIKEALDFLDDIIGISVKEDILDQIFRKFCIGK